MFSTWRSSFWLGGDRPICVSSVAEDALLDSPPVAFLFPGQGAQFVDMGRNLYESVTLFREIVDSCAQTLQPLLGLDLRTVLYPCDAEEKQIAERLLGQTSITQPAIFTVEYAMARLWMQCGISPAAMIGHSVGEYVAACLAGVFSLEDALALIAERGRLDPVHAARSDACRHPFGAGPQSAPFSCSFDCRN